MSLENFEKTGFGKLPEGFHNFVKMFVSLEEKMKKVSTLIHEMYDQKKGRNKDPDQLQKNINDFKKEINFLKENTEMLGILFQSNLSFLLDEIQIKEITVKEKQLLQQENINLKHELKMKECEINKYSHEAKDRAMIMCELTDMLNQLQGYIRRLKGECQGKDSECEMRMHQYNKAVESLNELKKRNQDALQKITSQNELLTKENVLLKKKIVELEQKKHNKTHEINRDHELVDQRILDLSEEIDNLRLEDEKKHSTISRLTREIETAKKEPELHIGMLTRENVMLQKLIKDQDIKMQQMMTENHDKITFKERAIQDELLELHSKLSKVKKENIAMKDVFDKRETEYKRRALNLEEGLRKNERNMKLYEEYILQAREVIGKLRSI